MLAKMNHWIMAIGCGVLVLLAVAFSWLRLGIDHHPFYHQWVQQEVSKAIGQTLKLESFQVKLVGTDLQLSLAGIETAEGLNLSHLDLGVHLWDSLQADVLRLSHIQAEGLSLSLSQQENGSWLPQATSETLSKNFPQLMLAVAARVPLFLLQDINLTLIPHSAEPISLPQLSAQVSVTDPSSDGMTRISVSLHGNKNTKTEGDDIEAEVEVEGQVTLDLNNSQLMNSMMGDNVDHNLKTMIERAQIYLQSDDLKMVPLVALLEPDQTLFHLKRLQVSGQYWLDFQAKQGLKLITRKSHAVLETATDKVNLKGDLNLISLSEGEAVFNWNLANWTLTGEALSGQVNGVALPLTELLVKKANQQVILLSPKLHLADTQKVLNTLTNIPAKINLPIQSLAPKGWLHEAQLYLDTQQPQDFLFTGKLQQVSIKAWSGVPHIEQADGRIWLNRLGGRVMINDTDGLKMRMTQLTSSPWQFNGLKGEVNWHYGSKVNRFSSSTMAIELAQGQVNLKMSASFPRRGSKAEPFMQLTLGAQNLNLAALPSLLPDLLLGETLGDWLTTAVPKGTLAEAALIYNGRPGNLSNAAGIMARSMPMAAFLQAPSLHYHQDWPQIESLSADLTLDKKGALVSVREGRVEHSQTTQSVQGWQIEVPTYALATQQRRYIKVSGKITGQAEKMMTWVQQPPMKLALPPWLLALKPQGDMSLLGSVAIPFGHQAKPNYDLKLSSSNLNGYWAPLQADIRHVELKVDLSSANASNSESAGVGAGIGAIEGDGLIDGQLVSFKRLSKVDLAQPWLSDLPKTILNDAYANLSAMQDGLTLEFTGRLAPDYLSTKIDQSWAQKTLGSLPFVARFSTCALLGSDCTAFSAELDLTKAGLDLPDPLRDLTQLQLLGHWQAGQQNWYASIDQHQLAIHLGRGKSSPKVSLLGANVAFQGATEWAQKGQWNVSGQIDSVDVAPWWEVYQQYIKPMWADSKQDMTEFVLPNIDVKIKHATWLGFDIDQGTLSLESLAAEGDSVTPVPWRMRLTSEQLSGKVDHFGADHPLLVHIHHAHFNFPEPSVDNNSEISTEIVDDKDVLENIDPSKFIDADVSIDELLKNGESYGQWQFKARRVGAQVSVHDIDAYIRHSHLQGNLIWSKVDGAHRTQFTGQVASDDMASLLVDWGYDPSFVAETAAIELQLNWPRSPLAFAVKDASGDLGLRLKKGSFSSTPNATSGLKVLALLDMSRLIRRVKLDFSDILQPGFSFDSITALYRFDQGVATTVSPVTLKSTALNLSLDGWIDFKQRQVDNNLIITLPVAEKLPLAALIAGLPQLSGMIYIVNKLIGDELSTFTSARYSVLGSLDNPDVNLVRIFDKDYQNQSVQERIENVIPTQ